MSSESVPTGSITFLFTDIAGSTRLWELHPETMQSVIARHDAILRQAIIENQGYLVKTTGDGCHAAFSTAASALAASLSAQRTLLGEPWAEIRPQALRVRMGLHTGEAEARAGDYYGPVLNRAARLMSIGHGGQILVSGSTAELVRDSLPDGTTLKDLGAHRLKDLTRPEQVFQLVNPDLPADFPSLHSLDAIPNNLPVQPTSFVGREREIVETRQMLTTARLVTLTGSGGTGKTRLSLQLAAEVLSSYPDGVWLVELAPILNPELILETVASTLRLQAPSGIPLLDLVTDYLRGKQLLLILDNCEHLIDACAKLANHFLRTCPKLKMIASSREALGIPGEVSYRVPSLSLPDLRDPTPASLAACESAQLFLERAMATNPHFTVKGANAPAVAQICHRLDGIPLALELAAARIKVFSAEQIASRLDDRFRLLTGGSRTALPRQQTLRALIDWSYDLLPEKERTLLRRLSVFVGGWTYEAAEALCPDMDVLDLLTQLINKSLVIADELQERSRYRMLETIRQYARERLLESGEMAAIRDRHFDYFLRLSGEAEPALRSAEVFEWFDRINPDFENIRNAMDWTLDQRPEDTLLLAGNLFSYLPFRTDFRDGLRLLYTARTLVEALPLVEGSAQKRRNNLRLRELVMEGMMEVAQGRNQSGADRFEEAINLAHQDNDDPFLLALALGLNAYAQIFLGNEEKVRVSVLECESHLAKYDLKRWSGLFLPELAWLQRRAGQMEEHRRTLEKACQPIYRFDHPFLVPHSLALMVEARLSNEKELAREFYRLGVNLAQKMKDPYYLVTLESEMAHFDRQEGRFDEAGKEYRRLIVKWQEQGLRAAVANQLECMAFLARAENELVRSACLLGAAEMLREIIDVPMADYERPEYDQEVAALRAQMEPAALASAWADGRAMNINQAVAYAVSLNGQPSQE